MVPRVQAYRARAADRRSTAPALDHSAVASLQRQIERLLRERRLWLANKLIDQFNLALQTGSIGPALALTLDEVRTQVTQLIPSSFPQVISLLECMRCGFTVRFFSVLVP